jgi:hypothetical protein
MGKLTEAQLQYISERRAAADKFELQLRRELGDDMYKNEHKESFRKLMANSQELIFFNHMLRLDNVEKKAEAARKQANVEIEEK